MSSAIFEPARKLIEEAFSAAWGTRTPIQYANSSFVQPSGSPFVAVDIVWGPSDVISIGGIGRRTERHTGVVAVRCYAPVNTGTGVLNGHLDFAASALRMRQLTDSVNGVDLVLHEARMGRDDEVNQWRQKAVLIAFHADAMF